MQDLRSEGLSGLGSLFPSGWVLPLCLWELPVWGMGRGPWKWEPDPGMVWGSGPGWGGGAPPLPQPYRAVLSWGLASLGWWGNGLGCERLYLHKQPVSGERDIMKATPRTQSTNASPCLFHPQESKCPRSTFEGPQGILERGGVCLGYTHCRLRGGDRQVARERSRKAGWLLQSSQPGCGTDRERMRNT